MDIFTQEEMNLMCIYDNRNLGRLISEISGITEPEFREIADNVVQKLSKMTDDEFDEIEFYPEFGEEEFE